MPPIYLGIDERRIANQDLSDKLAKVRRALAAIQSFRKKPGGSELPRIGRLGLFTYPLTGLVQRRQIDPPAHRQLIPNLVTDGQP